MHLLTDEAQPEAGGITQTSKFKPSRAPKDATQTREKGRATNRVNENYATRRKSLLNFPVLLIFPPLFQIREVILRAIARVIASECGVNGAV